MSKVKNMLVIKNVKSNLIEEAIIVFKENVKVKEEQTLKRNSNNGTLNFEDDICVKEAEEIINNYINELESKNKEKLLETKLKLLKILNILLVIGMVGISIFLF